jgi:hypothetical protein
LVSQKSKSERRVFSFLGYCRFLVVESNHLANVLSTLIQPAVSPTGLGNTRMLTNYAQQSPETLTHLQSFDKYKKRLEDDVMSFH